MKNTNLKTINDEIIESFVNDLKHKFSNIIKSLILFGSRARRNNKEDSDYDFIVIVNKKNKNIVSNIRDSEVLILNNYNKLISCIICNEEEWEDKKKFPIGKNIISEGIQLI